MSMTAWAFMTTSLWALIVLLFFMGAQSTFFGPLKYSILPQHLHRDELIAGNGLVSAGTYIAILTGTLCGGLMILSVGGRVYISTGVVLVSVAGYVASCFIPKAEALSPDLKIDWNVPRATFALISFIYPHKTIFRAMIGISWFWLIGSVFLAQFPTFAKNIFHGNEQVSTFFLILFSVGVGLGSTLCDRLLKGEITAKLVPFGCIGMSIAIALLYYVSNKVPGTGRLMSLFEFAAQPSAWLVMSSLVLLAASGGIFSVPLYAIMQSESPNAHRARIIAGTNLLDSLAMVLGAVFTALLLILRVSVLHIFLLIGLINLVATPLLSSMTNGYVQKKDGH